MQVEVEFSPLYLNQPLFPDVDIFLRNQEFTLFDLANFHCLHSNSPIQSSVRPGKLLWAEAFYFRDLIRDDITFKFKTPQQIFKLACIADIMHFPDYALELLEYLTINYGSDPNYNFANNIIESLGKFPELLNQGLDSLPIIEKMRAYLSSSQNDNNFY